eukprot:Skav233481  [mRNA]  locus=scaffold1310:76310:77405:+ [translate_table: standard]
MSVGGACDLHIWTDSQIVVDALRLLLLGTGNPDDYEHSDLWHQVQRQLKVCFATVLVHKVASHVDSQDSTSPAEDFAIRWNEVADFQAKQANQVRPSFFGGVWDRYVGFRRVWSHRVALLTRFHLAVAAMDCDSRSTTAEDVELEEEISPLTLCIESSPNSALFHAQFLAFGNAENLFAIKHDHHFVKVCGLLSQWIVAQDQEAATMRPVSYLEMHFVVRRLLGVNFHSLVGEASFTEPTLASDFRIFRRMLILFLDAAGVTGQFSSGHLKVVDVFVPQVSVTMGITCEESELVLGAVASFVGRRPVTSAQGMARPWRV